MNLERVCTRLTAAVFLSAVLIVTAPVAGGPVAGICAAEVSAADAGRNTGEEKIHITSDGMEFDQNGNQVEFTGNVVVTRLDITLYADHIRVLLYSDAEKKKRAAAGGGAADSDNIKQMVATGDVKIVQETATATADKAVYATQTQTIVLTGTAPKVVSKNSYITGKKITLYQADNRVVVESDKTKRVSAFFDSADTDKAKKK